MSVSGISSGQNSYAYYLTASNTAANTTAGAADASSPFANLNLSQTQQKSISQTLSQLQSGTITQTQAQTQINAVLTPAQQSQLQQNVAQLQTHRHHHHGSDGSSSSSSSSSTSDSTDTDAFGIPNTTNGSSTNSISDVAATFWAQSQTNGNT